MEVRGGRMQVDLRVLRPNPYRDFTIDPLDGAVVEALRHSIEEDGFWGGIVCRQAPDGTIQIGAGHHRVQAALEAGITHADVFVRRDMDDMSLIRVYARENATQRGNTSTALAGTVASAVRFLAKAILTGVTEKFFSDFDLQTLRSHLLGERGLGREVLLAFLPDIPGINAGSVQHQLANLKASGDYARLIADVEKEIAEEDAAAQAALEQAERERDERKRVEAAARKQVTTQARATARQAAHKAAERPKTFDFEGVAVHFKNPHQVDVFRRIVTSPGMMERLGVEDQAALAKQIVEAAARREEELSGTFIKDYITQQLFTARITTQTDLRHDQDRLAEQDLVYKAGMLQEEMVRHLRLFAAAGTKLYELWKAWPKGKTFPVNLAFGEALTSAKRVLDTLWQHLGFERHE
jgi:ParB-like nuclease domain